MSNRTYDILKWISAVGLPAFIALFGAIGDTWSIPYTVEIMASLGAIATFANTCLGISSINYKKGA